MGGFGKDRGEYLGLASLSFHPTARKNDDLVRKIDDSLLVRNDDDGALGALVHGAEYLDQVAKAPKVNTCLRLVKQRQLGAACHDHSDFDTLELAAGEAAVHLAVDVFLGAKTHLGKILAGGGDGDLGACRKRDQILNGNALAEDVGFESDIGMKYEENQSVLQETNNNINKKVIFCFNREMI
mgnify:CR=1 FL=1